MLPQTRQVTETMKAMCGMRMGYWVHPYELPDLAGSAADFRIADAVGRSEGKIGLAED